MIRTQIQLSDDQARRLRRVAARDGVSMAEVIRRCLDRALEGDDLDRGRLYAKALDWAGGARGDADLATHHDAYLDDAHGPATR